MKKIFVIALALVMAFCMFGCGQDKGSENADSQIGETFTSIPLGGSLGDLEIDHGYCGKEYVKIEAPADYTSEDGSWTVDMYYCEGSDTPYIVVYRWAKGDYSLEEVTAESAKKFGYEGAYQMAQWEVSGNTYDVGYYNSLAKDVVGLEGECFYADTIIFEDGDDFVSVDYFAATEEYELGEGLNQYLWIPKGYKAEYQTEAKDGFDGFRASYDEGYYLPSIGIAKYEEDYALETILWGSDFPEGLPFTEEQYNAWKATGWDQASSDAINAAIGFDVKNQTKDEINNCKVYKSSGKYQGIEISNIYIYVDEENAFNIFMSSELDPAPWYGTALINTLHSK